MAPMFYQATCQTITFPPLLLYTHQMPFNSEVTERTFFVPDAGDSGLRLSSRLTDLGMKTYEFSIYPILELHSLLTFKEVSFQVLESTFLKQKTKIVTVMFTYESSHFHCNIMCVDPLQLC